MSEIQWNALQQPNFAESYFKGREYGDQMQSREAKRNALAMYATNPQGAVQGLMQAGDIETANQLRQFGKQDRADRAREDAMPLIEKGDFAGAGKSLLADDPEMATQLMSWAKTAREEEKAAAQEILARTARALIPLRGLPPQEQAARWAQIAPTLKVNPADIDFNDPGAVETAIGQAMEIKDLIAQSKPEIVKGSNGYDYTAVDPVSGRPIYQQRAPTPDKYEQFDPDKEIRRIPGQPGIGGGQLDESTARNVVAQLFPGAQVTSGMRTPERNAAVGGAKNSYHLSGGAVDFVKPPGMTADQIRQQLQAQGLPITELLDEGDHIHWAYGGAQPYQVAANGQTPAPPSGGPQLVRPAQAERGAAGPPAALGLTDLGNGYYQDNIGRVYQPDKNGKMTQTVGLSDNTAAASVKNVTGLNSVLSRLDAFDEAARKLTPGNFGPLGKYTGDPKVYADAKAAATNLMMLLKSPEVFNLGVITGPDMQILESVVTDPGKFEAALRKGQIVPQLRQLASLIGEKYRGEVAAFKSLGGRPEALPPMYRSPRSQIGKQQGGQGQKVNVGGVTVIVKPKG